MGLFVRLNRETGYSQGFLVFLGLCILALILFSVLKRSVAATDSSLRKLSSQKT
jgi:hypothetical protein